MVGQVIEDVCFFLHRLSQCSGMTKSLSCAMYFSGVYHVEEFYCEDFMVG